MLANVGEQTTMPSTTSPARLDAAAMASIGTPGLVVVHE